MKVELVISVGDCESSEDVSIVISDIHKAYKIKDLLEEFGENVVVAEFRELGEKK